MVDIEEMCVKDFVQVKHVYNILEISLIYQLKIVTWQNTLPLDKNRDLIFFVAQKIGRVKIYFLWVHFFFLKQLNDEFSYFFCVLSHCQKKSQKACKFFSRVLSKATPKKTPHFTLWLRENIISLVLLEWKMGKLQRLNWPHAKKKKRSIPPA